MHAHFEFRLHSVRVRVCLRAHARALNSGLIVCVCVRAHVRARVRACVCAHTP